MSEHERYQECFREMYRKGVKLGEGATLKEIVAGLVAIDQAMEATELLFGCERGAPINQDRTGFSVFMHLQSGNNPELLIELAGNHSWSSVRGGKGLSIQVYPGEWLLVKEPTATNLLRAMM